MLPLLAIPHSQSLAIRHLTYLLNSLAHLRSNRNGYRCCSFGRRAEFDDLILYGVRSPTLREYAGVRLSLAVTVGVELLEDLISVQQILNTACSPPADRASFSQTGI